MELAISPLNFDSGRVEIRPDSQLAQGLDPEQEYELALEHFSNNRISDSLESLTNAILLAPKQAEYYEQLGTVLRSTHSIFTPYAESAFRSALEIEPDLFQARLELANLLHEDRRYPEGIEQFERILNQDPNHKDSHFYLAAAHAYTGEIGLAVKHYETAVALGASFPEHFVSNRGKCASTESVCPSTNLK